MVAMLNIIKKLLLWIATVLFVLMTGLTAAHVFLGDSHFDTGRNIFPPASQYLAPDAKRFNVALISDSATGNFVLAQVIKDIKNSNKNYSFILYLGDFVKDNISDFHWMMSRISPQLGDMPMYAVPGNHDVMHRYHVDKTAYKSVMGAPYYWFGYGNVLFVGLDLSNKDIVDGVMLQWLSDTLRKIRPTFKYCIIYGHIPPQSPISPDGTATNPDRILAPDIADKIKSIVAGHKVDAMFFGHVHYWSSNKFAGIPMYTLPASGQEPRGTVRQYGYVNLSIGPRGIESVEPTYIDYSGARGDNRMMWITSNIGNDKTRRAVITLLSVIGACLIVAGVLQCVTRRRK